MHKKKNPKAVAEGAIGNPLSLFKEFNNTLDRHRKAPKSLNFSTMTSINKNGPTQAIDINANWGRRSGSISSDASSDSEGYANGFIRGAFMGGATVAGMDPEELVELGELLAGPDSRTPPRRHSQASSNSGSLVELDGGVFIGRRDSMGTSVSGQSLTPSASSRPHLPGKRVSSNFEWDVLSKPRAGVREDSLARIKQLNNKPHKKLLNMGNKPRSARANSSKPRQPRVDSITEAF